MARWLIITLPTFPLRHAVGHGPFSHMYDAKFLAAMGTAPDFEHEHASIGIFDILITENNLMPVFSLFIFKKMILSFY